MNTIEYFVNLAVFGFAHLVVTYLIFGVPFVLINDNVVTIPKPIAGLVAIVIVFIPAFFAHFSAKARVSDGFTFVDALMLPIRLTKLKVEQSLERLRG